MPSYRGAEIFGVAVSIRHVLSPSETQINAFFGISGIQSLFGGNRGRTFFVTGCFFAPDLPTLNAMEGIFLSYADGIAGELVDTRWRVWPDVVFRGQLEPADHLLFNAYGLVLPYKALFHGLR